MLIKLSHINLYSKNPEAIADFLTSLFEIEFSRGQAGGLCFQIDATNFIIHKCTHKRKKLDEASFNLSFDEVFSLDEIKNKIEFYKYTSHNDIIEIDEDSDGINIKDVDGRIWRLSKDANFSSTAQKNQETHESTNLM
jgi:hypothetical protein